MHKHAIGARMLRTCSLLLTLVALCSGCGRNLYHYHRTVVGIDISGNVAGSTPSGHLVVGYSRRLVILMPPEVQDALEGKGTGSELPPTIFCTQVKASLGGVNAFREILATGDPAVGYAQLQAEARQGLGADGKLRNFVCPGYEIPQPD